MDLKSSTLLEDKKEKNNVMKEEEVKSTTIKDTNGNVIIELDYDLIEETFRCEQLRIEREEFKK